MPIVRSLQSEIMKGNSTCFICKVAIFCSFAQVSKHISEYDHKSVCGCCCIAQCGAVAAHCAILFWREKCSTSAGPPPHLSLSTESFIKRSLSLSFSLSLSLHPSSHLSLTLFHPSRVTPVPLTPPRSTQSTAFISFLLPFRAYFASLERRCAFYALSAPDPSSNPNREEPLELAERFPML